MLRRAGGHDCSVIAYDEEDPPPYTMGTYTPSTVQGCRAPHFWLPDGRSLYDALGPGYTLLRFDRGTVPLAVLDVEPGVYPAEYRHALVLCRADQHIVWRGDRLPADVSPLVGRLRGVPVPA